MVWSTVRPRWLPVLTAASAGWAHLLEQLGDVGVVGALGGQLLEHGHRRRRGIGGERAACGGVERLPAPLLVGLAQVGAHEGERLVARPRRPQEHRGAPLGGLVGGGHRLAHLADRGVDAEPTGEVGVELVAEDERRAVADLGLHRDDGRKALAHQRLADAGEGVAA